METQQIVDVGMHVEVELIDEGGGSERMAFDLVPKQAADFDQGLLGENTPLARAILDEPVGSVVPYWMGDICKVRILSARPIETADLADTAVQREVALKKALDAIERTNAAVFASSFSGKWGDYDPAGIEEWEEG